MKRTTRNPFSDQSVYDSLSSESEELHQQEKKLRLKVKIPMLPSKANEEENNDQPPSSPPRRRHFCEVCNKEFSSGKAFGGHVRIHSIEYRSKKKKKNKMVMKKKEKKGMVKKKMEEERDLMIKADVEEGEIKCCLCGKEFQSKHSLFGHMRRHPDRSWKGVRPPQPPPPPENEFSRQMKSVAGSSSSSENFKISSCSSDLDDDDDDVSDDDVMSSSMMDVEDAAYCLMMLSCSRSNHRLTKNLGFEWESSSRDLRRAKSEARKSCSYVGKGKEKVLDDEPKGGDQIGSTGDKGLIVDMKIKMEIEVTMNPRSDDHSQNGAQVRGDSDKRMLGFDLNQPYVGEDEEDGSDWFQI